MVIVDPVAAAAAAAEEQQVVEKDERVLITGSVVRQRKTYYRIELDGRVVAEKRYSQFDKELKEKFSKHRGERGEFPSSVDSSNRRAELEEWLQDLVQRHTLEHPTICAFLTAQCPQEMAQAAQDRLERVDSATEQTCSPSNRTGSSDRPGFLDRMDEKVRAQ